MKKLLFAAALISAASALATTVDSANTFGVFKLQPTTNQTVVCIPWVAVGNGNADVRVADLVMASNRLAGDTLWYYDSSANNGAGEFKCWELEEDTDTGTKSWNAVSSVTQGRVTSGTAAALQTVRRGGALIICTQKDTSCTPAAFPPIYLCGQYTPDSATTSISGSESADTWSLLAPPKVTTTGVDLNASENGVTVGGSISSDDYIILPSNPLRKYKYNSTEGKWGYATLSGTTTPESLVIPAGQGAWYVRAKGMTSELTFTWPSQEQ